MKFIKKYWKWLILLGILGIVLLMVPKIIDSLFSVYLCDFTAMNYLKASDILDYFATIFTVVAAFIGIGVTVKQFKLTNKSLIVPLNQKYYYYQNPDWNFLSDKYNIRLEQYADYVMGRYAQATTMIELKNIGKGNADDFTIEYDFTEGKKLIKQLIDNPFEVDKGFDTKEKNIHCGIILSSDSRYLPLSNTFYGIIKLICQLQHENYHSTNNESQLKNNILVNTENKICSMNIKSLDFLDGTEYTNNNTYGVYLNVSPTISLSSEYSKHGTYSEVLLIMKREK